MKRKPQYTLMDELMASPTKPVPPEKTRHQLTRMHSGLESLERGESPNNDDWRVLSDAVNLVETLIEMGEVADAQGLHKDAMAALAMAGKRHLEGKPLRLDGEGIKALRALLTDYAEVLAVLPERTMVRCHRRTEKRIHEILVGKRRPHDVEVMAI